MGHGSRPAGPSSPAFDAFRRLARDHSIADPHGTALPHADAQSKDTAMLHLQKIHHPAVRRTALFAALSSAALVSAPAWAGGEQDIQKVVVTGQSSTNLVGVADSANVGTVTQKQLEARTVYRPGELLESTPGLGS